MSPFPLTDVTISDLPDDVLASDLCPSQMTEAEFVAWAEAHEKVPLEWVNGTVVSMSPASTRHVQLFVWLLTLLESFTRRRKLGKVFGSDLAVRLSLPGHVSRRCPDILFVAQNRLHLLSENHFEGPPDLAIEIVSPDSAQRDWTEKRIEYETARVREYWIIDIQSRRFEALALNPQGTFTSLFSHSFGAFTSQVLAGLRIEIEWRWAETAPDQIDILRDLGVID